MKTNTEKVKKQSFVPSGFFGNSPDNIVEIENFMTDEELNTVQSFAKNLNVWDVTESHFNEEGVCIYDASYWENRVATSRTLSKVDPKIIIILEEMQKRLQPTVEIFFGVSIIPTSPTIVRWMPGQYQLPHADKELHEGENAGKPNDFPYYDLSSLFYLNDDYLGGELYFPKQDVKFKPKMGAAYFFPGDLNYIHGITEIKDGIRYTCPFFWTITDLKKPQKDEIIIEDKPEEKLKLNIKKDKNKYVFQ